MNAQGADHDVLVIGAGPAGSATAGLLAAAGLRVLVLEKDEFPRFHIGESLLPGGLSVLSRLGVEPTEDVFLHKRGAEFLCETTGRAQVFAFDDAMPGAARHAWQVERASFDTLLRDRARALGAEVRHGVTVSDAAAESDHVWVETRDGTHRARYLVDASGQSRLLARRADAAEPYERFGRSAAFTHYEDIAHDVWAELAPHFDIKVVLRPSGPDADGGWGWIIPLAGRRLSVGLVSQGKVTPADLDADLIEGPTVQRLTRGSRRLETHVTGNYSYRSTLPFGSRFAAVGDAACFLDPVFSSGVTLALRGAEALADRIAPALAAGTESDADLMTDHAAEMERATRTFAGLIDRFYNSGFPQNMLLHESLDDGTKRRIISVLAGDVWRDDNEFQEMLLAARRRGRTVRTSS